VDLFAVGIYETIAVILGAIWGYHGGTVDMVIMRIWISPWHSPG